MPFQAELKKAGLSDKEAVIYITALTLGPSTVQVIARRAKIARGTTYVIIERLIHYGLMSQYMEGKRRLFVAEPPEQVLRLMEKKQKEIEHDTATIMALLPKLHALRKKSNRQTVVRYYAGVNGLAAMRREMVMYSQPGDIWCNLTPVDHLRHVFGEEQYTYTAQRIAKHIHSKTIFTTTSGRIQTELMHPTLLQHAERRFVSPEKYTSTSGFTVYRDHVAIGSFKDEIGGIIIESAPVANMMRQFFEISWQSLV